MKFFQSKLFRIIILVLVLLIGGIAFLYEPDIPVEELKAKYANSQSKFINIDGQEVHYRVEGEGYPLVLVHGTGSMLQSWDGWTQVLSPHYKIIRMDIPAFGLTGPRADRNYSSDMYVNFIDQLTKQLGIDSFYLGGNSLGGLIAWKYAEAHPEKVTKLILVDPAGFHSVKGTNGSLVFKLAAQYPGLAYKISKLDTRRMVKRTLNNVFFDKSKLTDEKVNMYDSLNRRPGNREAFIDRMQYRKENTDDELKKIPCPTLVMWGNNDELIDVKEAGHFKNLPNASFVFYDNMGHVPQEEIPERSAVDVLKFLK